MVMTESKNTPVGVFAIPDESTSNLDLNTSWLRLQVTNSLTGVERYKSDMVCIELDCSNNEPRGGAVMSDNEQLKREFTEFYKLSLTDDQAFLIC